MTGAGSSIIFIHGLGIDSRIFKDQVDFFQDQYRAICYDLRGHGRSSAPKTGYSYKAFADELKGLVDNLKLRDFHLVGLSMGGAIAARYFLENPGPAKSISFVGAHIVGYQVFEKWPNFYKIAQMEGPDKARETWNKFRLFETVREDHVKYAQLTEMIDEHSCAPWLDPNPRYEEINDLERISKIDVPVLITIGRHDQDFAPVAHILRNSIPKNRFREFDAGHLVSFESSQKFNNLLLDFLKSIE